MYWLCIDSQQRVATVVYAGADPMETEERWDESYPYDNRDEAREALEDVQDQFRNDDR